MNSQQVLIEKWQRGGWIAAVIGTALGLVGFIVSRDQFFISYLYGYIVWFSLAMGSLIICMIYSIVGGKWGQLVNPLS